MRYPLLIFCCSLIFSCFSFFVSNDKLCAQPSKALEGLINEIVDEYIDFENSYGLSVGIIDDGQVYKYQYGKLSKDKPAPPNAQTIYHIGAISKVYTTAIFSALVKEGVVNENDPLSKFLPANVVAENGYLKSISLKDLATHTSGLPKEPYNIALTVRDKENLYANYHMRDAYDFLADFRPKVDGKESTKKPIGGNRFRYSHLGIGLLGFALEEATGKSYDELLQQYIIRPLGMTATYSSHQKIRSSSNVAKGHYFNGRVAEVNTFASLKGSEAIRTNLNDLLKFVQANMDSKNRLYPTLAPCHTGRVDTDMKYVRCGYGWYVINQNKKLPEIHTHSGRTAGFSSYVSFCKERGKGVVLLSNSSTRVDELGIAIMDFLLR